MAERIRVHSTLERKIRLIFGLMILLIIIASFFFPWYEMESLVSEQDLAAAREMGRSAWLALHAKALSPKVAEDLLKLQKVGPPPAKAGAEPPRQALAAVRPAPQGLTCTLTSEPTLYQSR